MATTPQFAGTPRIGSGVLSGTANTLRDGTGAGIVSVFAGKAGVGSRIDRVDIVQAGPVGSAPGAGMVRLFLYDGANTRLLREVPIPANTPTASAPGPMATVHFPQGLNLPDDTWILKAASQLAGAGDIFNVIAHGADF